MNRPEANIAWRGRSAITLPATPVILGLVVPFQVPIRKKCLESLAKMTKTTGYIMRWLFHEWNFDVRKQRIDTPDAGQRTAYG